MEPIAKNFIKDGDTVYVNGDINHALMALRKKMMKYRTFPILRERTEHPSPGGRKRAKLLKAEQKRQRRERRKNHGTK